MPNGPRRPFVLPRSAADRMWDTTGPNPQFWERREADLHLHFQHVRRRGGDEHVTVTRSTDMVIVTITGMNVPGDRVLHDVTIEFHRTAPYRTFGLPAEDFPRVRTTDRRPKHHAYKEPTTAEGPLCLWFPKDSADRRWTSDQPISGLVEIVRNHLFLEQEYRRCGKWLAEDAPHGFPEAM